MALGAIIYYLVLQIVLWLGLNSNDLKLLSALVVAAFLALPYVKNKYFAKPVKKVALKLQINGASAIGIIGSLATSATTFELMKKMDDKGIVLNSAFAISGAFTFAGHLAFTLSFDQSYILPVIVGKLIAGFSSLFLAVFMAKRNLGESTNVH